MLMPFKSADGDVTPPRAAAADALYAAILARYTLLFRDDAALLLPRAADTLTARAVDISPLMLRLLRRHVILRLFRYRYFRCFACLLP